MQNVYEWGVLRARLEKEILAQLDSPEFTESGMYCYALADAGQIPWFRKKRLVAMGAAYRRLFEYTKEHGIAQFGPVLIRLDGNTAAPAVAELIQAMRHGWTVSWVSSALPLDELAEHLAGHLNGTLSDDSEVLIRYYDPRLLPVFLENFAPEVKKALLTPIHRWIYWDRKLKLKSETGYGLHSSGGIKNTDISVAAQTALAKSAIPDLIVSMLREEADTEEFEFWLPHTLFNAVEMKIGEAREYGLEELEDLQLFVSLALRVHPKFHEQLEVFAREHQSILNGDLSMPHLTLQIPDSEWNRLGESGKAALEQLRRSLNQELALTSNAIREKINELVE